MDSKPKKTDPQLRARRAARARAPAGAPHLTTAVAGQQGVSRESVQHWPAQADVDDRTRPGITSEESAEVRRLKAENKRLREDNEILRRASIFFAGELEARNR